VTRHRGRIVASNPVARAILGLRSTSSPGKTSVDQNGNRFWSDARPSAARISGGYRADDGTARARRGDGRAPSVRGDQVVCAVSAMPLREGWATRFRARSSRSPTSRGATREQALRDSQVLLNATQELTKVGGWHTTSESKTVTWTDEVYRIHEVSPDAHNPNQRQRVTSVLRARGSGPHRRGVPAGCGGGSAIDLELRLITANGERSGSGPVGTRRSRTVEWCALIRATSRTSPNSAPLRRSCASPTSACGGSSTPTSWATSSSARPRDSGGQRLLPRPHRAAHERNSSAASSTGGAATAS